MEQQPSNIINYPNLHPVNPPRRHRRLKLVIYALILAVLAYFVYSHFIANPTTSLIRTQSTSANLSSPSPSPLTGYWDQSQIALPSYPPVTSSTDLNQAASGISIPDFSQNYSNLKSRINQ